jgi:serine/threonine-protein kinase
LFADVWAKASTGGGMTALADTEKQAIAALPAEMGPPWFDAGMQVRLAILAGDFAHAASLVKTESAIVAAVPELGASYLPHYDLTGHLLEIALETGDDRAMRQVVGDFLAHRDAWAVEVMMGHAVDLTMNFARLMFPAGEPPPPAFEAERKAFIDRALFAGADRAQIWSYAYASPASTASEAQAALDALADYGPPSPSVGNYNDPFGRLGSPEADLGHVYLLAGRLDEAIDHLRRAVATCDVFPSTIDHVRAALNLGRALEQKGDKAGACDAYTRVLAQWGNAKPRSVTADAARKQSKALGCGSG